MLWTIQRGNMRIVIYIESLYCVTKFYKLVWYLYLSKGQESAFAPSALNLLWWFQRVRNHVTHTTKQLTNSNSYLPLLSTRYWYCWLCHSRYIILDMRHDWLILIHLRKAALCRIYITDSVIHWSQLTSSDSFCLLPQWSHWAWCQSPSWLVQEQLQAQTPACDIWHRRRRFA